MGDLARAGRPSILKGSLPAGALGHVGDHDSHRLVPAGSLGLVGGVDLEAVALLDRHPPVLGRARSWPRPRKRGPPARSTWRGAEEVGPVAVHVGGLRLAPLRLARGLRASQGGPRYLRARAASGRGRCTARRCGRGRRWRRARRRGRPSTCSSARPRGYGFDRVVGVGELAVLARPLGHVEHGIEAAVLDVHPDRPHAAGSPCAAGAVSGMKSIV